MQFCNIQNLFLRWHCTFIYFRHLRKKKKNPHRKNLSGIKINLFFQAILINFFVLRCTQWGATLVKISFPRGVHVKIIEYVIQVTREISSCSVISNFVSCKLAVKISTMVDAARKITTLIIPLRSFLPCNRGSPDNFLFIPGQNVFVNCQFPLLTRIYIYIHTESVSRFSLQHQRDIIIRTFTFQNLFIVREICNFY